MTRLECAARLKALERQLLRVEQQTNGWLAALPGMHAGSPRLYDSEDIRQQMRKLAQELERAEDSG